MKIVRCNRCGQWIGREEDLKVVNLEKGEFETCPNCGSVDALMDVEAGCNFDLQEIKKLWHLFEDVPMNPETEKIEEDFLGFPAGTDRLDIWKWFDEKWPNGVYALLYQIDE